MRFKKFFEAKAFLMTAALALFACGFTACSSDDDGDGDGGGTGTGSNTSELTTRGGLLIESIGDTKFFYDNKNRLSKITYGDDEEYEVIDYSKNKYYIYDEDEQEKYDISFNDKGYVTKIYGSMDGSEKEGGYTINYNATGLMTFTYDANGYITTAKSTSKQSVSSGGYKYSENDQVVISFIWQNGNLVRIESEEENKENGILAYSTSKTVDIEYNSTQNKYMQFPYRLLDYDSDGMESNFFATGLLGKGPKNLPHSAMYSYVDRNYANGEVTYTSEHDNFIWFKYVLNNNGTISSEGYKHSFNSTYYNTIAYSYVSVGEKDQAEVNTRSSISADSNSSRELKLFRSLFNKNKRNK